MRTRSSGQAPVVSTVLVLTNEDDTTAGMVIEALVERGAVVVQVDTGDFPQRWTVTGRIDSAGVWQGGLVGPDVVVDLELVTAIYYRRPSRYRVAAGLSAADRRFAEAEAHHGDPATVEDWLDAGAVGVTANQFQRYIADKDADLRVTDRG